MSAAPAGSEQCIGRIAKDSIRAGKWPVQLELGPRSLIEVWIAKSVLAVVL
jgi:hypothetical protein